MDLYWTYLGYLGFGVYKLLLQEFLFILDLFRVFRVWGLVFISSFYKGSYLFLDLYWTYSGCLELSGVEEGLGWDVRGGCRVEEKVLVLKGF